MAPIRPMTILLPLLLKPITQLSLFFVVLICLTCTPVALAEVNAMQFNGTHLVKPEFVRFPINQYLPSSHIDFGDSYQSLLDYVVQARYYRYYPDIMGYERHGNGYTGGDDGLWLILADADASGLGSMTVDFPGRWDGLAIKGTTTDNGLLSPHLQYPIIGITVFITSFSPELRFQPSNHVTYVVDVPCDRWDHALYVDFAANPLKQHWFAVHRRVVHINDANNPNRQHDPVPDHVHDEL